MQAAAARTEAIDLGYEPRDHFVPFHMRTQRWSCIVAHRRAGKTVACIADLVDAALRCDKPNGRFAYVAPTYGQSKDIAWSYLKQYTAAIPGVEQRESELIVNLPANKARIRLYGADNYDRMRGIYLDGVVMDEIADIDPRAWSEVIRPALSDRAGWAVFIGTPKGRNRFWEMWKQANKSDEWFALQLKASETGLIADNELASARATLNPSQYAQEYECDFTAAVVGAYYGTDLQQADDEKRITSVPWDRTADVVTAWDLGIGDQTAIWFAQVVGRELHLIDYYEASGQALDHYVQVIKAKPYVYTEHLLPHDVQARELGTGKTRQEVLQQLGIEPTIVKQHSVDDGINAVRLALSRCWFDSEKTERGVDCLRLYRAERDEKNDVFKTKPVHDWASHGADAFRYLIMGLDEQHGRNVSYPKRDMSWVV